MTVISKPGSTREVPEATEKIAQEKDFVAAGEAMMRAARAAVGFDPDGVMAALAAESSIVVAGGMLKDVVDQMDALRLRLRAEDRGAAAEAIKLAKDLRAGAALMMEERNRLDKLRKETAGGVAGAGMLDLAAARDEIGRRLACLRRAGGS